MGFFKDFKDDFSEAVDEMIPTGKKEESAPAADDMINTITENVDVDSELSKLDGLLEQVAKRAEDGVSKDAPASSAAPEEKTPASTDTPESAPQPLSAKPAQEKAGSSVRMTGRSQNMDQPTAKDTKPTAPAKPQAAMAPKSAPASDENAVITSGMTITGDLESTGSIEIQGRINGNVRCNGKLTITGIVKGNSAAAEFFADSARVEGEINSTGTVKVGAGSIVIGNITATSAVIAGAVKGDIDVDGPVVVDTSAIVMGNVKSRSVQINNGAVIEGFCSQAYADINASETFDKLASEAV